MLRQSLLLKTVLAVILGMALGKVIHFIPYSEIVIRVLNILNSIFIDYLVFLVPLMVIALITSGILELGEDATYLIFNIVFLSVFCMLLGCILSYIFALVFIPFIAINSLSEFNLVTDYGITEHYLEPLMSITSALVLAFSLGLAGRGRIAFRNFINDLKEIVLFILNRFIVPIIPFYVGFSFFKMTHNNLFSDNLSYFLFLSLFTLIIHWALILIFYTIAGIYTKSYPIKMIFNMLPSYITGIGTMSSAVTIPVTLSCSEKNDVKQEVNDFVIPICATINLSGTAVSQIFCSLSIYYVFHNGVFPDFYTVVLLIFNIIILLIAAPGVPGGAVVATMPVIQPILGLSGLEVSILYAIGIANDTFATGANVINDGAVAKIINHKFNKK